MAIVGSAYVEVRAEDKNFERDIRAAAKKIKDVVINVTAKMDTSAVTKQLDELSSRYEKNPLIVHVDANVDKANEKLDTLYKLYDNTPLVMDVIANTDEAITRLEFLRLTYAEMESQIRVDAETLGAEGQIAVSARDRDADIAAKAVVEEAERLLNEAARDRASTIVANANTAGAETQLGLASRNRRAKIGAFIDPVSMKALKGAFNTLTGTLPMDAVRKSLSGVIANFEGIVVKVTLLTSVLGGASAGALTLGANLLAIGGDLTKVVGIASMLPAVLSSAVTTGIAMKMAWKDFGGAFDEDAEKAAEALAKLPPEAQEAAKAIKGLYEEVQQPTQNAFWEQMGTALQDMIKGHLPNLITGMSGTGAALGNITQTIFRAIESIAGDRVLGMFENLNTSLNNMAPGFGAAVRSFTDLGEVGSAYLPRLGEWMSELSEQFANFISVSKDTGEIDRWIRESVETFKTLGGAVLSTSDIFEGLTKAARESGAGGLSAMADGLRNIADIVNGEPFQSRLITVLEGARRGTDQLGEGFRNLTSFMGESSTTLAAFLDTTGGITGQLFDSFVTLFDGTGLGSGMHDALVGLDDALRIMEPGLFELGAAFGQLGTIGGELLRNMAPGLNQLFETINLVLSELFDGIMASMPVFNEFIQALLNAATGPLVWFANVIGNILEGFAGLPGVMQTIIMSLGLFLAAMMLIGKKWPTMFSTMNAATRSFTDSMALRGMYVADAFKRAGDTMANNWRTMTGGLRNTWSAVTGQMRNIGGEMATAMGKAFSPITTRLNDMMLRTGLAAAVIARDMKAGFAEGLRGSISSLDTVRQGFTRLGDNIKAFPATVGNAIKAIPSQLSDGLTRAVDTGKRVFSDLGKNVASQLSYIRESTRGFTNAIGDGMGAVSDRAVYMRARMANAGDAIKTMAKDVGNSAADMARYAGSTMSNVAGTAGQAISKITEPVRSNISRLMNSAMLDTRLAASAVGTAMSNAAGAVSSGVGRVATAFAPVRTAVSGLGDHIRTSLGNTLPHFTNFAKSAGGQVALAASTFASGVGSTLSKGAQGLLGVLGGGWGAALMVATIAVGAFAKAESEAKARTEELTGKLDQQTGAWTRAAKEASGASISDGNTGKWDDLWRGVGKGAESTDETLSKLGLTFEDMGEIMADPAAREQFIEGLTEAEDSMFLMQDVSEETAKKMGLMPEAFKDSGTNDLDWLSKAVKKAADEAERAEREFDRLAKIKGITSVEAKKLQANFDVLENSTSSVSDKVKAFQSNLDINSGGLRSAREQTKSFNSTMDATKAALTAASETYGETTEQLYKIGDGFDLAKAGGRDLDTVMQAQATSIHEVGIAAYQKALDSGKQLDEAARIGADAMKTKAGDLRAMLEGLEIPQPVIDSILADYDLLDEDVMASLLADGTQAKIEAMQTQLAIDAFADGNYEAVLSALPDEAKQHIEDTLGLAGKFAEGDYTAILEAFDRTEGGSSQALLNMLKVVDGDYSATLKAKDGTLLGIQEVENKIKGIPEFLLPVGAKESGTLFGEMVGIGAEAQRLADLTDAGIGVTAEDETKPGVAAAMAAARSATGSGAKIDVGVEDKTYPGVMSAKKHVTTELLNVDANIKAGVDDSGVSGAAMGARGRFDLTYLLPSGEKEATVADMAQPGASSAMNTFKTYFFGHETNASVVDAAAPGAQGAMTTFQSNFVDRPVNATVTNQALGGASGAMGTFESGFRDRSVDATVNDRASGTVDAINNKKINDKSFSIVGLVSGLTQKARDILGFENGGILNGAGIQQFADGGIVQSATVKAFANGGVENHTAQIAKAGEYRLWAEAETGGEAYIPLALSKRARSLKILEEVMKIFGYGMYKKFADGGVLKSVKASRPSSSASTVYSNPSSTSTAAVASPSAPTQTPIIVQVNPSAVLDEEQVGQAAARELYWRMMYSQK